MGAMNVLRAKIVDMIMAIIIGVLLTFILASIVTGETISYDPAALLPLILEKGESLMLSPSLEARYLAFHSDLGFKDKDHISNYATVYSMLMHAGDQIIGMPVRLAFNRETWTKDAAGIWTVDQRIAMDDDLDGEIDSYRCTELREDPDGRVLSIASRECDMKSVADFIKSMVQLFLNPPRGI